MSTQLEGSIFSYYKNARYWMKQMEINGELLKKQMINTIQNKVNKTPSKDFYDRTIKKYIKWCKSGRYKYTTGKKS